MNTLSTGEIAKFCDVNVRTVIRWIDKGQLKGYKLPGRGNNRIKVEDFIQFLKDNQMPIPEQFATYETPRILIVDDDRSISTALQRTFTIHGFKTSVASDGFQAGIELMYSKPQLMTLDLSMPDVDGFQVLHFVRKQDEFQNLKVVVLSSLDSPHMDRALAAGADVVLPKPYDAMQLLEVVSKLLNRQVATTDPE